MFLVPLNQLLDEWLRGAEPMRQRIRWASHSFSIPIQDVVFVNLIWPTSII